MRLSVLLVGSLYIESPDAWRIYPTKSVAFACQANKSMLLLLEEEEEESEERPVNEVRQKNSTKLLRIRAYIYIYILCKYAINNASLSLSSSVEIVRHVVDDFFFSLLCFGCCRSAASRMCVYMLEGNLNLSVKTQLATFLCECGATEIV